jgi:uncharacterized protein YvpB
MERSVLNALKASDVKEEDIKFLEQKFKGKFFNVEECDKELVKLGYEPIFVIDYDEDDYYEDDEYDDEYEKISQKKYFDD